MEPQMDRLTVAKHCQHTRLIKEDDEEIWISSEDLRTEGSSDEATSDKSTSNSKKIKKQKKGSTKSSKNLKQKNITCLPDINTDNLPPASSHDVEFFENDWPKFKIDVDEPSTSSTSITISEYDLKRKQSLKTSSSDLDSEALNLESQWRPKRGSLKLPVLLAEGQTTANFAHEITSFYENMKYKLSSLKVPVPIKICGSSEIQEKPSENLLDNWKCSPEIQDQLNFIKKLDDDISETMSVYQAERLDRIKIQNGLCKEVAPEREAQKFIQLCDFSNNANSEELCCAENVRKTCGSQKSEAKIVENKFVQRNIVLARDGNMTCSLTDEEKQKLDDLLRDIEECNYQLEECSSDTDNLLELEQDSKHSNGFVLSEADVKRLEEMNLKLANLEEEKEDTLKSSATTNDSFWQKFLPNEALKDINAKLESLRKDRLEEEGLLSQTESEDEQ